MAKRVTLRENDEVRIYWADYEIQTGKSAESLAKEEPCLLCTAGRFSCVSDDGLYYIIAHNYVTNKDKKYISDGHSDCTRVLIKGIADIDKYSPPRKPAKKKAKSGKSS